MKKLQTVVLSVAIVTCAIGMVLAETKYASDATAAGAAVNFGAKPGSTIVKYLAGHTSGDSKTIDCYVRSGSPEAVSSVVGTTNIQVTNPSCIITNSDKVMYQYANGTVAYGTVTIASPTNVVISPVLAATTSSSDKLYELTQAASIQVGATNTAGVAAYSVAGDEVLQTPSDSPLRVHMNGATQNVINVTVQ